MYARQCYDYDYCDMYEDAKPHEVYQIQQVLNNTKEFVEALTEELTGTAEIDLNAVNYYLGQIHGYLNMKDACRPLTITRSGE